MISDPSALSDAGSFDRDEVIETYSNHLNPGLARLMAFAGFPVEVHAEGSYVFAQDGEAYLDFLGGYGVFSLGHRHPKVIEAVKRQLDQMPLSAKAFFNPVAAELAEKLAKLSPEGLEFAFFVNSGTEAVEAALKFARAATGRPGFVSTLQSYHGKTLGALSVTGRESYRKPFQPLLSDVAFVPFGDVEALKSQVNETVAAVIIEPIQGEGGIIVPPDGYLSEVRAICDAAGALMIADEVQTGLGRTGHLFAVDREGVKPDLLTLAKALGGGVMPIGAVLGTEEVWGKVFGENPLRHTSTFGGNPLACAAALAALDVIEEEGLVAAACSKGGKLKLGLESIAQQHSGLIAEVRGRGLMLGVEFREDEVGELVVAQMLKRNLFVAYTLNNPRVLRFEPPLTVTDAEILVAIEKFEAAVAETAELLGSLD
jgi:putrescine aminotransferase